MLADLNFKIFPIYISYNTVVDFTNRYEKQTKHVHLPIQI